VSPEVLRDVPAEVAAPLLRLTASASRHWPETGGPAAGGESRPARFDAVLRVLLAVAEQRPVVLPRVSTRGIVHAQAAHVRINHV
jgi:hypothetical protein